MHIRHSFDLRLVGQSLKRIGAALKDVGAGSPTQTGTASLLTPAHDTIPSGQPELHDHFQRTALLTRLAIDLRAALDPAAIMCATLAAIGLYSDAGVATIVLMGEGGIELAWSNTSGQPQPMPPEQARRLLEHELAGWDWRASGNVFLANTSHHPGRAGAADTAPSGSVMALPLAHGAASLGILTIHHPLPGHFSSQDLLLFEGVAAQAGLALGAAGRPDHERPQRNQPIAEQHIQRGYSFDPMHIIFDHLPDGLVLIDVGGLIVMANDAFCEDIVGILPRAATGRSYAAIIQELEQTEQITIEPHPSIPVLRRARCAGGDGRQRWYEIDRYGVADHDGAEQMIERWRDITRQVEQQRELLHDEQVATMARLAANVVHEIGNPLQSVRSCIDLSRDDRTLAPPTAEYLELASSELRRMSQILTRLRDLYRLPVNEANNE